MLLSVLRDRMAPITKNYPAPNVNSVGAEKPWSRIYRHASWSKNRNHAPVNPPRCIRSVWSSVWFPGHLLDVCSLGKISKGKEKRLLKGLGA